MAEILWTMNSITQPAKYKIKKKKVEPAFLRNCFDSKPLSEKAILTASSFYTLSKSSPISVMKCGIQSSV
jgi:hypothetical protein